MTPRRWVIFLAVVFAAFLVLELWSYFSGTSTLSQVVWALDDADQWFRVTLSFFVGGLFGHFFFPRKILVLQVMDYQGDAVFDVKSLKELEQRSVEGKGGRPSLG